MDKTIKFLTEAETRELYRVIDQDSGKYAIRNRAIFYLGKYCALRASEIGLLRIDDYDPDRNAIYCRRLKNGASNKLRIVDPQVSNALNEYIALRNSPLRPLFLSQMHTPISRQSIDLIMKNYCEETTLPGDKRHFHVLRHTRAIEIIETTGNIYDAQYWLGHKNIQNTLIYLRYTTKQQEQLYKLLKHQEELNND